MSIALQDKPTQKLICVDNNGKATGKIIDRKSAHSTPGVKHLAIQILVFNSKKELVLHERPNKKVGGGVLDAPTTHILEGEKPTDAALRCLKNEYGITDKPPIQILEGYTYDRDYGDGSCENEFCLAAFTRYSGKITPNKEEVIRMVNINAEQVAKEIELDSNHYPVWFGKTVAIVKRHNPELF